VVGGTLHLPTAAKLLPCRLLVSSTAILVNKHILVDLDFPFPCTVAALGVTGTSIISNIAVRLVLLHKSQRVGPSFSNTGLAAATESRVSWRFYCTYIAPAGLLLALGLHMGNTAYLYLSGACGCCERQQWLLKWQEQHTLQGAAASLQGFGVLWGCSTQGFSRCSVPSRQ
jgi:hypothetical protein